MVKRKINLYVESIMVILLLIIFAASICILIFQGSHTYKTIIENKTQDENVRIALSYINMRLKQNDVKNHIDVSTEILSDKTVLVIHHHGEEDGLLSYVYVKDGLLWECYTDGPLDHNLSSQIIPVEDIHFTFNKDMGQLITDITYHQGTEEKELSQLTTLRSY